MTRSDPGRGTLWTALRSVPQVAMTAHRGDGAAHRDASIGQVARDQQQPACALPGRGGTTTALTTYIRDHLTGSSVIVEVGQRRLRRTHEEWLRDFLDELHEERAALHGLVEELGEESLVRRALGRSVAVVGRAKLLLDGLRDDDLRDLLELELFETGVNGKLCLWRSLQALADDPRIAALEPDELEAQGERQAALIEEHRLAAAARLHPRG